MLIISEQRHVSSEFGGLLLLIKAHVFIVQWLRVGILRVRRQALSYSAIWNKFNRKSKLDLIHSISLVAIALIRETAVRTNFGAIEVRWWKQFCHKPTSEYTKAMSWKAYNRLLQKRVQIPYFTLSVLVKRRFSSSSDLRHHIEKRRCDGVCFGRRQRWIGQRYHTYDVPWRLLNLISESSQNCWKRSNGSTSIPPRPRIGERCWCCCMRVQWRG